MSLGGGRGSLRNSNRADGGRRPELYVEYGTALAIAAPGRGHVCWHRQHLQMLLEVLVWNLMRISHPN